FRQENTSTAYPSSSEDKTITKLTKSKSIYVDSNRSHQRQRLSVHHDARAHREIEDHLAVLEPILEVHVGGNCSERRRELGQGEVVGGDETDGSAADERPDDGFGANPAVV